MFNSYHAGNHTQNINAVTGAILKNHPDSWFERFHLTSTRANTLLKQDCSSGVIVLQMVLCGDDYVLAECVRRTDYCAKQEG